jgi:Uncharacterized protein conserved in bacteria (DUF2188)
MTKKARRPRRGGLPKGAHRVRIEVASMLGRWYVRVDGLIDQGWMTQRTAIRAAVSRARREQFASVRIHDRRGKFQSERTFPRSSDPCPPKG